MSTTHRTILHRLVAESPSLGTQTRALYLADLDLYVDFVGTDPASWTRVNTTEFYRHLLRGRKPQSANRIMAGVAYAAKWYASQANDPSLYFAETPKASKKDVAVREAMTEDEVRALLDTCAAKTPRDLRDFAIMVVAVETGMRRMSLAAATWENQKDTPYPCLHVPLKGVDGLYAVPLSDAALRSLSPWRQWSRTEKVTKGHIFRRLDRANGGVRVGAQITPAAIYEIVQARAAAAGLGAKVHPHAFRHTFTTWRLSAGQTPFQVSAVTGHRVGGGWGGTLYTYADKKALGAEVRNSTPPWLASYVEAYCKDAP